MQEQEPQCSSSVCTGGAVAQWQRRLTDEELAEHVAAERERRDRLVARAEEAGRVIPAFGALPCAGDCTRVVFACADHAIPLDLAARVHESGCSAPDARTGQGCDCAPEPLDLPPMHVPLVVLPAGWAVAAHKVKGQGYAR